MVVGVVVVVLVVVVVVVCAWQLPLAQFRLQHWTFLVQFLPLRLHPGGSADTSAPMPSDPSVPPRRAAPINLRALSDGATVLQPLGPSRWGALYGMLKDRFGITWIVDVGGVHDVS